LNFCVFPFFIGTARPEKSERDFHFEFARFALGVAEPNSVRFEDVDAKYLAPTSVFHDASELVTTFDHLAEIVPQDVVLGLVDLSTIRSGSAKLSRNAVRGSTMLELLEAVASQLADNPKLSSVNVFVIVDRIPLAAIFPGGGSVMTAIRDGRLTVVDIAGQQLAGNCPQALSELLRSRFPDNLVMLDRKMIKRRGWFPRIARRDEHLRDYYDGRLAQKELTELILDYGQRHQPDFLAFSSHHGPWLHRPLLAAVTTLEQSLGKPVHLIDVDTEVDESSVEFAGDRVLIVPLIDKGNMLEEELESLNSRFVGGSTTVLAVMKTDNNRKITDHKAMTQAGLSFDFFLEVDLGTVAVTSFDSHPLVHGVGLSDPFPQEEDAAFTPYEFWDLVGIVGMRDVASDRLKDQGLTRVPNFEQLIVEYGAWVAHKLQRLMHKMFDQRIEDALFVHPSKPGGPVALAELLFEVYGATVIPMLVEDQSEEAVWKKRLSSLDANIKQVFVLDEFIYTGERLADLVRGVQGIADVAVTGVCIAELCQVSRNDPVVSLYTTSVFCGAA
jgi:hypothetical protein